MEVVLEVLEQSVQESRQGRGQQGLVGSMEGWGLRVRLLSVVVVVPSWV